VKKRFVEWTHRNVSRRNGGGFAWHEGYVPGSPWSKLSVMDDVALVHRNHAAIQKERQNHKFDSLTEYHRAL